MTFPYHVIDLTHSISPSIPTWEGGCGFTQEVLLDYGQCTTETPFCVQQFTLEAGIGTHIDAPAQGSFALILPVKIQGATEAPVRLLALVKPSM